MQTKKNSNIADILFVILLTGYSLMLVNQGMTLTDTGYNYGNFTNADSLDNMWKFSTYLANALGSFFTHLPLGRTLLGLNVYTGLVKAATAVMTYLFCVRSLNMRRGIVFASQLMALGYCWCPTALLYNYCTYFLFTLGAILLCLAVQSEKTGYYIGAGVCLGVNVLVRFPNLAEMTLIAALWTYCIIKKKKLSEGIKRTGWCVLGYLTGIAVMIGIIFFRYGPATYIEGIRQLFAMSAEAPSYSMKAMVMGSFLSYVQNLKWLGIMFLFAAVGIIVDYIIPETLLRVKRVLLLLLVFGMIVVFYLLGMYRFIYYAYPSIYTVGIVFLMVSGLLALAVLFFGKERYDLRMHAAVMGVIILITPLGSNNLLFTAENNLFFVTPFVFSVLYDWWEREKNPTKKKGIRCLKSIRIITTGFVIFAMLQGVVFGATFVFRDGIAGEKRTEKITDNRVLQGVYTNQENADLLRAINTYLEQENLKGSTAILYYNVPALAFYMELQPALSSTWPDLDSFSLRKFEEELTAIAQQIVKGGEKPMVVLGCDPTLDMPKLNLLREYMEKLDYQLTFSKNNIWIYR